MKKTISITIITMLIIGMLGGFVQAASASVSASTKSVEVGNTVKVTVSFGQKVSAAQFVLNFDTSKLEYVSKSSGGLFSASTKKYGYNSEDGVTADLGSVTFTFKTKAVGNANVSVSGLKISNATQTGIAPSMGSSSVSITVKEKEVAKPEPTPTPTPNPTPNPDKGSSTGNNSSSTSNKDNVKKEEEKKKEKEEDKKEENENTQTEEPVQQGEPKEEKQEAPNELIKLEDENTKKMEHEETKIMIKSLPTAIEDGTVLNVNILKEENENYHQAEEIMKKVKGTKFYFDIQLLKDNTAIQPNGYVTVFLPIPEGISKDRLEVYFINTENGNYELQQGEIQGEYYTFTTNHFSTYVLVEKPEPKTMGQIVGEIFTNLTVLYSIIGVFAIIIIGETIVIVKLNKKQSKRSK